METNNNTVEQVCDKLRQFRDCDGDYVREIEDLADEAEAAHKREIAAKDAEIESLKFEIMTLKSEQRTAGEVIVEQTNKVMAKDAEIASLRSLVKELADAILKSPSGEIYQLGLSDDDGNFYDGCAIRFSPEESLKMPRVGHGDMFAVMPYALVAKAREVRK